MNAENLPIILGIIVYNTVSVDTARVVPVRKSAIFIRFG